MKSDVVVFVLGTICIYMISADLNEFAITKKLLAGAARLAVLALARSLIIACKVLVLFGGDKNARY